MPRRFACSDKQSNTSSYSSIKVFRPVKEEEELVSQLQKLNRLRKSDHSEVSFLSRSAHFTDDVVVSNEYVTKLLYGLNPPKALEPDELHPRVLQELATELGRAFAQLFQKCLDTGEIPKEWSLANICLLYKNADRALARNYGPVSLTCVPCKLLEHIVCSNIMAHLDEYKLLSDRQPAFRKRHSCETQLTTVINDWAKILDNEGQVDTFILDFEKAFDTPPHELLKSKLFWLRHRWEDTEINRAFSVLQTIAVNGANSDWAPVLPGVPHDTVLGPCCFLCTLMISQQTLILFKTLC